MIDLIFSLFQLMMLYSLAGVAVTILVGGRDPLDPAPAWVIVAWPVVAIVAAVGTFALWAAQEGS